MINSSPGPRGTDGGEPASPLISGLVPPVTLLSGGLLRIGLSLRGGASNPAAHNLGRVAKPTSDAIDVLAGRQACLISQVLDFVRGSRPGKPEAPGV